ncbi:hypothetical protein VNO80_25513 [Phaseolus coccineus]|uniref:Uncharacterized protein n=1 Tax=Phaseolus coccineus TaxID=3886 RepID=A0AAN9QTF5_PHACN
MIVFYLPLQVVVKSTRPGNKLNIVSIQNRLILHLLRSNNRHTLEHVNFSHLLLTEEISDFDGFIVVSNAGVDEEVSIHEPHLVAVALGDVGDKIVNVAEGGANGSEGFLRAKPGIDLELLLVVLIGDELKIKLEMFEVSH